MLAAMVERVFLGWDRPFLTRAADWLLEQRSTLPGMCVVVPTSQAGRRLHEAMAERAGALLSPSIRTPGSLLKTPDPTVATDWVEQVAWMEVLENVEDWSAYQDLFPEPPAAKGEWAGGLAQEMLGLRRELQENGLTLAAAARVLGSSVEAGRWDALARLEKLMETTLHSWKFKSRSRLLANGIRLPDDISGIVLAGVTEFPPLLEKALLAWNGPVTVLIGAPESESAHFSPVGRPLETWSSRTMPWPELPWGSVTLVADLRQEATEALRVVAERNTPSNEALGSTDAESGGEIARTFTRAGWPAFHPAALPLTTGLTRWLTLWSAWLTAPLLSTAADLFALPETEQLTGGGRAFHAEQLSRLRNDWLVFRPDDLRHRMAGATFRTDPQRQAAESVLKAIESLEHWRTEMLTGDFLKVMADLLSVLGNTGGEDSDQSASIMNWLDDAAPLMKRLKRGAKFWLDLMLEDIPHPALLPPDGRVIDVQGWLELFFEPGTHLVLCGMNEGKVPARKTDGPWLGEAAGKLLGLTVNSDRAARDAFLYQSMVEARRETGRVDVICAKSGPGGEALQPSRILLASERDDLPARVQFLFGSVEPPEAGLRWHADWKWQPRKVELPDHYAVTVMKDYLACPFRFYLKHALRMQSPEPGRLEWNPRDFGNIAHDVLERWGSDTEARDYSKTEAIHAWLSADLDRIVTTQFGKRVPLSVRIQSEALRQRFAWFARIQACSRAEGWEVVEVEHRFEIPIGDTPLRAKIDRIDRHRDDGRLRVLDYKTGKLKKTGSLPSVEAEHRTKIIASTVMPEHLGADSPAVYAGQIKGKPAEFRWTNLQLPLYAEAVRRRDGVIPSLCYFTLGNTESEILIQEWADFSSTDLDAAMSCAEWIVAQIKAQVFWPPAEKTDYDDFSILCGGRSIAEVSSPVTQ